MVAPTLTIFANFRINNEERYRRMRDSFNSFKHINATKWVINVRGLYKLKTILFLREQLGEKLYPHLIESEKGWFYDTREMLPQIDTDFVFFWIEDHINLVSETKYDEILNEMQENKVDFLIYSWWHDGIKKRFEHINRDKTESLSIYQMNLKNIEKIEEVLGRYFYMISAVGIFGNRLFKKVIQSNHPRLKRWPKETPFDFEKRSYDREFLPFTLAIPNSELFASIDDDQDIEGYSLVSRGYYKSDIQRETIRTMEYGRKKINRINKIDRIKRFVPLPIRKMYSFYVKLKNTLN